MNIKCKWCKWNNFITESCMSSNHCYNKNKIFATMELRSYNVERIYLQVRICEIKGNLGVDKKKLAENKEDILDMLHQIKTIGGYQYLMYCNYRKDGEMWTPSLQIVKMLIKMGEKLGAVKYKGELNESTLIEII